MITVVVNSAPRETSAATVADLVAELALPPATLLVEHSGTALHRSEWNSTALNDGDRIELLRVAAGG